MSMNQTDQNPCLCGTYIPLERNRQNKISSINDGVKERKGGGSGEREKERGCWKVMSTQEHKIK